MATADWEHSTFLKIGMKAGGFPEIEDDLCGNVNLTGVGVDEDSRIVA